MKVSLKVGILTFLSRKWKTVFLVQLMPVCYYGIKVELSTSGAQTFCSLKAEINLKPPSMETRYFKNKNKRGPLGY